MRSVCRADEEAPKRRERPEQPSAAISQAVEVLWQPEHSIMAKRGLYANIAAKRARIKAGSGEKMRKPGSKGAPTAKAFRQSAKAAKRK